MPLIPRIKIGKGLTRVKHGEVNDDVEFILKSTKDILDYLNNLGDSKAVKEVKEIFGDLNKGAKRLDNTLSTLGSMVYPTIGDKVRKELLGDRVAKLPDYGRHVKPLFFKFLKYSKEEKNAQQVNNLAKHVKSVKTNDLNKDLRAKISKIDTILIIVANRLS